MDHTCCANDVSIMSSFWETWNAKFLDYLQRGSEALEVLYVERAQYHNISFFIYMGFIGWF